MTSIKTSGSNLPAQASSYWLNSTEFISHEPLKDNLQTEVAVVGGGITGITAAYLLAKEGMETVLIDADRICGGTTGHTTAKVTSQHGLFYDELIQHTGLNQALTYYRVNERAKAFMENIITTHNLDCQWKAQDAVVYASSAKSARKLEKEKKAYQSLGIPFHELSEVPFNVPVQSALAMENQAQFHPLHYLSFLVQEFVRLGGKVYENTVITDMVEGDVPVLETRDGHHITCRFALSCTHFPFYDRENYYFTRMYAERSYVIAVKHPRVEGMYLSDDTPKRSVRSVQINGEDHLLIGGESHKTGQGGPTMNHYEALETFAQDVFGATDISYRWSAQDLYTLDKIPYIGVLTDNEPNTFLAAGFRKWGMTSGTAAAIMLKNYVTGNETDDMALFDPNRFLIDPSLKQFLKQNMNVAKHFVMDKLQPAKKKIEDVQPGEGTIVSAEGRRAGAYRDEEGKLHLVDTTCTHLGCEVEWNNGDLTWDCPCHGSRFNYKGEVVEGPAKDPLDKIED